MKRRRFAIQIDKDKCIECGKCKKVCSKVTRPKLCSGCGKCIKVCDFNALSLIERKKNEKSKTTRIVRFAILFLLAAAGFSVVTMLLWNV